MTKKQLISTIAILSLATVPGTLAAAPSNEELSRRIEALSQEIEKLKLGDASSALTESEAIEVKGLGPSSSKVYRQKKGVSIAGYGEMLYENYDSQKDDSSNSAKTDQVDLVRAVMYLGYRFNDSLIFNSEIEFEHASTSLTSAANGSGSGEVSVEFAYVDWLIHPWFNVRAGLLLMPMGWITELHEPTTWLGARRPETETSLIPSTWRENGVGVFGSNDWLSYRSYLTNPLDAQDFASSGLRSGRQKGGRAKINDFAWTTRVDFTGVPGLVVGVAAHIADSGNDHVSAPNVGTQMGDIHVDWKWRGLEVRALFAGAKLKEVTTLNQSKSLTGTSSIGETLWGAYGQLGYDLATLDLPPLTPYFRIEALDTQAKVPAGFLRSPGNRQNVFTYGLAYKPIHELIVKADYQNFQKFDRSGIDQINLALGYAF